MIATESTDQALLWNQHMTNPAYRMYQIQNSILSMQQILQYCYQAHQQDNHKVQLLHVVDTAKYDNDNAAPAATGTSDSTNYDPKYVFTVNVTRRIHHLLTDFYGKTKAL